MATPAFVQNHGSAETLDGSGGTPMVLTLSGSHTAGNFLVLSLDFVTQTRTLTVVDNNGNSWTAFQRKSAAGKTVVMYVYSGSQTATSVTVTFNASSAGAVCTVDEFSGTSTTGEAGNNAVGASGDCAVTWTVGGTNELSYIAIGEVTTAAEANPPTSFTKTRTVQHSTLSLALSTFYAINLAAGSTTATATRSIGLTGWTMIVESFTAFVASFAGKSGAAQRPNRVTFGTNGGQGRIRGR